MRRCFSSPFRNRRFIWTFVSVSYTVNGRFVLYLAKWLTPTRQCIHNTLGQIRQTSASGLIRKSGFESRIKILASAEVCAVSVLLLLLLSLSLLLLFSWCLLCSCSWRYPYRSTRHMPSIMVMFDERFAPRFCTKYTHKNKEIKINVTFSFSINSYRKP